MTDTQGYVPPHLPGSPVLYTDRSTLEISVDWPTGRAEQIAVTSDMFEAMIASQNTMLRLIRVQAAVLAAQEQGQRPHGRLFRDISALRKELQLP